MATTQDYIEYVMGKVRGDWDLRCKKMFGEYMVYVNDKPVLLVCDNTVFVKPLDCIAPLMVDAEMGYPYAGAKEHYILDVEDVPHAKRVIEELEKVTPIPKPRKKKAKGEPPKS